MIHLSLPFWLISDQECMRTYILEVSSFINTPLQRGVGTALKREEPFQWSFPRATSAPTAPQEGKPEKPSKRLEGRSWHAPTPLKRGVNETQTIVQKNFVMHPASSRLLNLCCVSTLLRLNP